MYMNLKHNPLFFPRALFTCTWTGNTTLSSFHVLFSHVYEPETQPSFLSTCSFHMNMNRNTTLSSFHVLFSHVHEPETQPSLLSACSFHIYMKQKHNPLSFFTCSIHMYVVHEPETQLSLFSTCSFHMYMNRKHNPLFFPRALCTSTWTGNTILSSFYVLFSHVHEPEIQPSLLSTCSFHMYINRKHNPLFFPCALFTCTWTGNTTLSSLQVLFLHVHDPGIELGPAPSSKPTHCWQSYDAPCWVTPHPYWAALHPIIYLSIHCT